MSERPTRVQAAFDVFRGKPDTGPNATALFEYVEQLELQLAAAMRQLTGTAVAQYLLSNVRARSNGAAKAHYHDELTRKYVAMFRAIHPDLVRRRHEDDYKAVHDTTAAELTDRLDEVIGFDLDGFVSDEIRERFFQKFHEIALSTLQTE